MAHSSSKRTKDNNNNNANHNSFALLSDGEEDEAFMDVSASAAPKVTKNIKIPPIKVLSQSCETIHSICTMIGIDDYRVKKTSIGVMVLCDSEQSNTKLMSMLTSKKFEYFTHPKKNTKLFKAALFGPEGEPAECVKSELVKRGLKCVDVKSILKERNFGTETIYITYFENGSTNLQDLKKKCPTLFHTIIRWNHQRKPKGALVQCRNCQIFGHGESNCHVGTKCALCGKNHKTSTCTVVDNFCCVNCGLAHRAFDRNCPQRSLYQEIRERATSKSKPVAVNHATPQYAHSNANFPPLAASKSVNHTARNPANRKLLFNSYADAAKPNLNGPGHDLFTIDEINSLLMEMLPKLRVCRTKHDQFHVITQLAIKFLYQ